MPSSWIMRPQGAGCGPPSSHALNLLGKNLDGDPHLAGPAVSVAVLARVLLGEGVDVRVGALLRHLDDTSPDLEVAVRIVGVLHGERDRRIALEVPVLHPSPGGVEPNVDAVVVHPDRGHLRRAVAADGRDVSERLLAEEVTMALGNRR